MERGKFERIDLSLTGGWYIYFLTNSVIAFSVYHFTGLSLQSRAEKLKAVNGNGLVQPRYFSLK